MAEFFTQVAEFLSARIVLIILSAIGTGLFILFRYSIPYRIFFDMSKTEGRKIVIGAPFGIPAGTQTLSSETGMPIFGYGPLFALQRMTSLLTQAYGVENMPEVFTSASYPPDAIKSNLILIGFPLGNALTKAMLEKLSLPIGIEGHTISIAINGAVNSFTATYESGEVTQDYGLFIRARNPFNRNAWVLVMLGSETYGVKAIADFIHDVLPYSAGRMSSFLPRWMLYGCLAALPSRFRAREFAVLVRAPVKNHVVGRAHEVVRLKLATTTSDRPST